MSLVRSVCLSPCPVRSDRILRDSKERTEEALEQALKATGLEVRVEAFEGRSLRDQAEAVAGAAVFVAAHGAGMANLIFLDKAVRRKATSLTNSLARRRLRVPDSQSGLHRLQDNLGLLGDSIH